MTHSDDKRRYHERLKLLKGLIRRELPDAYVDHVKVTRLLAVQTKNTRVIFSLDESLMTGEEANETIFADGVHLAKEVFKNPPRKHSQTQGIIHLSRKGASLTQRFHYFACVFPGLSMNSSHR
jgi:hypothetical protein